MLKQHFEISEKALKELQDAHAQLEDDLCAKKASVSVDAAIVRLRKRKIPHMFIQSAST